MISVKDVHFSYPLQNKLLTGITFSAKKGDFVALIGENGSGKSTLLKLMLNELSPLKGKIILNNKKTTDKKDWDDVGYVPQRISFDLQHPAQVKELIGNSAYCSHLNLTHLLDKQFKSLSGGQQQRVLVALALRQDADILLLDEPTIGVDEKTRRSLYKLLSHLCEKHHKTVLIITHDLEIIKDYTEKVFCIDTHNHTCEARCIHD